ncbi:MAG: MotA/TolQ/ExbB proton channel family protein [Desulfobacteraceae bacterium]|nr:MotA/TolQ/ExbB proton channel family protein [Desulfobacteraceae bacterium]
MKARLWRVVMIGVAVLVAAGPAHGQDMRARETEARQTREALMQQAAAEKRAAEAEAAATRARITEDRAALNKAIASLEAQNTRRQTAVEELTVAVQSLEEEEAALSAQLAETDGVIRELVGLIRVAAKDTTALWRENLQSALDRPDLAFLQAIAEQARFPGMADVRRLVAALESYIQRTGEVALGRVTMVDRSGRATEGDILTLGCFTAAYRLGDEIGFLTYAEAGQKLHALSRLPAPRIRRQIARYMTGETEAVYLDISRGAALRQLTHELSLWEQVPKGGPIVWPILVILAVGVMIVIERLVFLLRKNCDAEKLMQRLAAMVGDGRWADCRAACRALGGKPVARVLATGLECCHLPREEMENALQEAILREVPPLERFLSTLGMLAAIAPLLGLLGTVTGMIATFHVITHFGTGDPRMMSGGISEALVTTMLGLSVAIPIMLAHTLLNRAVDKRIGQMEEKALALVNSVHKSRNGDG